jgi:gas vesicle protein
MAMLGGSFLAGAALGGALGVLFAPKSGKETRDDITAKAVESKDKAEEMIASSREKAEELIEHGKVMVEEKREQAAKVIKSGEEAIHHLGAQLVDKMEGDDVVKKTKVAKH